MKKKLRASPQAWKERLRGEIQSAGKIVVLAVGRRDKGDDAAGLLCAETLKKMTCGKARGRLRILFGRETPESLTGEIRKEKPEFVVILDAARGRYRAGTVFIVEKDGIADEGISTHAISLRLLVSYLEETIPCRVLVLGIQPLSLSKGETISPPVKKAAAEVAEYLASVFLRP